MDKVGKIKEKLRGAGFKATPARVALLTLLSRIDKPLPVKGIVQELPHKTDQTTVYRTLNSLVAAGLIKQLKLQSGLSHYELASLPHHHHLICEKCGLVEDVTACCEDPKPVSSSFKHVNYHDLEYFGICETCAK